MNWFLDKPSGADAATLAVDSESPQQPAHRGTGPGAHHLGNPWFLALTALGVVYGDIGTSPLYAFQVALTGIGHPVPAPHEVFGIVSMIFWALMLMVSLKYVVFVLRADNEGEGGTSRSCRSSAATAFVTGRRYRS